MADSEQGYATGMAVGMTDSVVKAPRDPTVEEHLQELAIAMNQQDDLWATLVQTLAPVRDHEERVASDIMQAPKARSSVGKTVVELRARVLYRNEQIRAVIAELEL